MTPITTTNTEVCRDSTNVVTKETDSDTTTTKSCTDNQTTTITETTAKPTQPLKCPCGNLNLRKLVEETRCWAFKSSNIAAANANAVMIFAMKVLQEIIISECHSENPNVNNIILIAAAIGEIGQVIKIYNPQPFNS